MMKHLAVIMDGNRRWAKRKGLHFSAGYQEGFRAIERTTQFCLDNGIEYLSLYTFSLENFKRPENQKIYLFDLIAQQSLSQIPNFMKYGIRAKFVGERDKFPPQVLDACQKIEEETKKNDRLQINFLFCYGARQELVCGVKSLLNKIKKGLLSADNITEKELENCMWTQGIPDPELIIRTSGAKRLSNFLLYQAAYSEFHFLECDWPEVDEEQLSKAVQKFAAAQRNVGV